MPEFQFRATLYTDTDEMHTLLIPKQSDGFFRFSSTTRSPFLQIEARNGQWYACCLPPAYFTNTPAEQYNRVPMLCEQVITIDHDSQNCLLYIEPIDRESMIFHNYFADADETFRIGNDPGCDIFYDSPFCGSLHATIRRTDGTWYITDCSSVYGTYVNGRRILEETALPLGGHVSIMGMHIIAGTDFLAISSSGAVSVSGRITPANNLAGFMRYSGQNHPTQNPEFYNRTPRKKESLPERTVVLEGPPMSLSKKGIPLILRLGSSMVMGGVSALAGNFTMLFSSVLFPLISTRYSDEEKNKYESLRNTKYREYLEQKRREILSAKEEEEAYFKAKYPDLSTMMGRAAAKTGLWERRPGDDDFLHLRLGLGRQPMNTRIDYPQKRFELDPDELEDEMYQLAEAEYHLEDTPVVLSLMEDYICSLQGSPKIARELILKLAMQIAALHSYDEVKLLFVTGSIDPEFLDLIRYLPHVWDNNQTIRFIATEESEAFRLGEYLQSQLPEELESEKDLDQVLKKRPFYVVFALDKKLFDSIEIMKRIMQADHPHGVAVITAFDQLPKECQQIIRLEESGNSRLISLTRDDAADADFWPDSCRPELLVRAARTLSNTKLRFFEETAALPKMVPFLDMFQTDHVEHLNPLKRWQENNPVKSLAAPVGVGTDGSVFTLDLHEKYQGPHGLVAGMTGSGKSEFLITYILSMAVNYHPDEVAFVLIDYKGGGLAGAFENPLRGTRLPHLVGTITNLDGSTIQRSLISLESELMQRQKRFNEVKSLINEGTMDIYDYQKLYRAGKLDKPMPHLFIISDEFAELKQQRPEFIDKLISIARIGRSLGVHLILATQKPSGVVNDQIRSNTKFRACLRVQERADSMDMLKRPEAAELTDTGRFYLQVGYNEYFALAQSAWCGAPYEPSRTDQTQRDDDRSANRRDTEIEFVDTTGQKIAKAKPRIRKKGSGMKQLVAIVDYLSRLADSLDIHPRQLWTPELPARVDLQSLAEQYAGSGEDMTVFLGLVDDPANQEQFPLRLDFETCQNVLVIGNPGSGKTTVVQSILWSLTQKLSADDLNFYLLDYSSRMLKTFAPLPHCGSVLLEEDHTLLDSFFEVIENILAERKRLFSELEVDSFQAARSIRRIPLVVVAIDNFAGLSGSRRGEAYSAKLQTYLKNSAAYGVKFIITCSRTNEVTTKIRTELGEHICLSLKDKYDYSDLLGSKAAFMPPEQPGRGLCRCEDRALEYQAAILYADEDEKGRIMRIKEWVQGVCKKYGVLKGAQSLSVTDMDSEFIPFADQFEKGRFPLGFANDTAKPVALPLKQFSLLSLYFGNPAGAVPILNNLLYCAEREKMEVWVIKRLRDSLFDRGMLQTGILSNVDYRSPTKEALQEIAAGLQAIEISQKHCFDQYCAENGIPEEQKQNGMRSFPGMLEKTNPLLLLIENAEDFCAAMDSLLRMRYLGFFLKRRKLHLYIIACFEPDFSGQYTDNALFQQFCDDHIILFGGNLHKQKLLSVGSAAESKVRFNDAQMVYRGRLHRLYMPCGKIEDEAEHRDKDLDSIF